MLANEATGDMGYSLQMMFDVSQTNSIGMRWRWNQTWSSILEARQR